MKNFKKVDQWKDSITDQPCIDIVYMGKFNHTKIAEGCSFTKMSLMKNPKIRDVLPRCVKKVMEV